MTDEEYLAEAGIKDEAAAPAAPTESAPTSETSGTPTSPTGTSAPSGGQSAPTAKTAAQKAIENFELMGKKYPVNTEFQITHGGKILKVPYSTLANTYRQAAHFEEKNKAFSAERTTWEQKKAEYDAAVAFKQKYGALQDWSEKNPDDWKVLYDLYQNRDRHLLAARAGIQGAQPMPGQQGGAHQAALTPEQLRPFVDEISNLKKELGQYRGAYTEWQNQKQTAQETKDTEFVKTEISDFQKEYPEINLNERDPEGIALWAKIIQWGLGRGYTEFAPAAMMFLKQRVNDTIASRARAEALKGFKAESMAGVVKRSPTPFNQGQGGSVTTPKDLRKMSYAELAELSKSQLVANGQN